MSIQGFMIKNFRARSDRKRDSAIPLPQSITECRNISYGSHGKWNLLDVYYPDGTTGPLPTIVSIHGGGYVYGTKEVYRRYGMDMASRGFAFVNFNYRLAPKWKFPKPLSDTNHVMQWICRNAQRYHLDPNRIILLGDSAGAQLTSQYAAILTNPAYAANFQMKLPDIHIRALGLHCGMYDFSKWSSLPRTGIASDYLAKDLPKNDPRLAVLEAITPDYPPAYITTSCTDFLRENAEPMFRFLSEKGIPCRWKCYGTEGDKTVGHVFHINIALPEAKQCNDDAAAFFREYL